MTGRPFDGPVRHVYVHVPFCRARCDYCDFVSRALDVGGGRAGAEAARLLDTYVDGVAAEWERERAAHDVRRLRTLYLGGGTPSLLGPDRLERLLELFRPHLTPHAEVTVETNPEDVDDAYAAWAASTRLSPASGARPGVRISLGAQSFSPGLRAVLGRTAQADPAEAFRRLRAAGVANVGLDLIHGIPGQTPELLETDIAAVLELRPDHVSWYELDVVEGTALAARLVGARGAARAADARTIAGGSTPASCPRTRWTTCGPPATGASCASSPAPATTGTRSATSPCRDGGRATTSRTGAPAPISASARAP